MKPVVDFVTVLQVSFTALTVLHGWHEGTSVFKKNACSSYH